MSNISFTTTATNRIEIIEKTFQSFSSRIIDLDFKTCKLYINIDPLPIADGRHEVVEMSKKYFGEIVANTPEKANFTRAVNWLWSTCVSDYAFHLDDDWVLLEDFRVRPLIKELDNNPKLLQCILRAYPREYAKACLSPSIIKKKLYSEIGGKLDEKINPEIQLRDAKITKYKINGANVKAFPETMKKVIVKDIGRQWIKGIGFQKPKVKGHFNKWEKRK